MSLALTAGILVAYAPTDFQRLHALDNAVCIHATTLHAWPSVAWPQQRCMPTKPLLLIPYFPCIPPPCLRVGVVQGEGRSGVDLGSAGAVPSLVFPSPSSGFFRASTITWGSPCAVNAQMCGAPLCSYPRLARAAPQFQGASASCQVTQLKYL